MNINKSELRKRIRSMKRRHDSDELAYWSEQIAGNLLSVRQLAMAKTVLLYYPLSDEVDVRKVTETLLKESRTVLLPKVLDAQGNMELRLYTGETDLLEGAFHILEPCGKVFSNYGTVDVAIVPGLAFDNFGHRLGRGKGYYDRILPKLSGAYKIGACFGFQLCDCVPTQDHDVLMDAIVTEEGIRDLS